MHLKGLYFFRAEIANGMRVKFTMNDTGLTEERYYVSMTIKVLSNSISEPLSVPR